MLKEGVEKFGKEAADAITKEFLQFQEMDVFEPVFQKDLTYQQIKDDLKSLSFLTEEQNGDIKCCTYADGQKQRTVYQKEDVTAPTVATESVLPTSTIEADEDKDLAIGDILCSFLHTDQPDIVIMVLHGFLVECMLKVEPEWGKEIGSSNLIWESN